MGKEDKIEATGTVIEPLPGTKFKVQLEDGKEITAHLSGRIQKNFIKILPGDKVTVALSIYDLEKGIITYRHKN